MARASGGIASQINPGTSSPGNASYVINGQLVPSYRSGNYYPRPLAVAGPGGISSGISNPGWPPQTSGPAFSGSGSGSAAITMANTASASPFNWRSSPVLWILGAIVVVALMMHFVHHGY